MLSLGLLLSYVAISTHARISMRKLSKGKTLVEFSLRGNVILREPGIAISEKFTKRSQSPQPGQLLPSPAAWNAATCPASPLAAASLCTPSVQCPEPAGAVWGPEPAGGVWGPEPAGGAGGLTLASRYLAVLPVDAVFLLRHVAPGAHVSIRVSVGEKDKPVTWLSF